MAFRVLKSNDIQVEEAQRLDAGRLFKFGPGRSSLRRPALSIHLVDARNETDRSTTTSSGFL
jgi:hypothetical protein